MRIVFKRVNYEQLIELIVLFVSISEIYVSSAI